jgi:sterol desaturase/sphingolipid hydroxylase (fatty acid hydroxylase superfamily)
VSFELLGQIQAWVLAIFAVAVIALEWLSPLQRRPDQLFPRWLTNIGLYLLSGYVAVLILPAGLLTVLIDQPGHGLAAAGLPLWITLPLTMLIIDAWRYWVHRWLHEVPLLWRAHLVHHSDTLVDVTTSQRHHPLEAVASLAAALGMLTLLGLPVEAVAIYYIFALAVALVSHGNIDLPPALDRVLRTVIITPAVHAIHHSDRQPETDSNYGAVFTRAHRPGPDTHRAATLHLQPG